MIFAGIDGLISAPSHPIYKMDKGMIEEGRGDARQFRARFP